MNYHRLKNKIISPCYWVFLGLSFFHFISIYLIADEILTDDLELLKGKIKLTKEGVILEPNGKKQSIDRILDIQFQPFTPILPAELIYPQFTEKKDYNSLPIGWKNQDIKASKGSVRHGIESREPLITYFVIKGAGAGFSETGDTCNFTYTQLFWDFDFIAKIRSIDKSSGCAGIMTRTGLEPNSPFVSIGLSSKEGAVFQYRGKQIEKKNLSDGQIPNWVRLKRVGKLIFGYYSKDGRDWSIVGSIDFDSRETVYVGLFIYSGKENVIAQSRVSDVLILDRITKQDDQFLVIKDHTRLYGRLNGFDGKTVNFLFENQNYSVPVNSIAHIRFAPIPFEIENKLAYKPMGVLMANGEYLECEILAIFPDEVEVSTRAGRIKYKTKTEALVVAFNTAQNEPADYEIYKSDGSLLFTKYLKINDERITADVSGLNNVDIPQKNLVLIRRIGSIMQVKKYVDNQRDTAIIETKSGEKISGYFDILNNKISLTKNNSETVAYELNEIKQLKINWGQSSDEETNSDIANKICNYSGIDIGITQMRGRHLVNEDSIIIEASATAETETPFGSYYFLNSPVEENFEMVVRLKGFEKVDSSAFAGISVVDKPEKIANGIQIAYQEKYLMILRKYDNRPDEVSRYEMKIPVWLRAERNGRRLSVYSSKDGKRWGSVFHYEKQIPTRMFAGLIAGSGEFFKNVRVYFDDFNLKGLKSRPFKTQVILTDGSEIKCNIISANDSAFRLYTKFNQDVSISSRNIRLIFFNQLNHNQFTINENRCGALLSNNDFIEAEFKSMEGDNIVLSSVILGMRYYKVGETVQALVLNKPIAIKPNVEVVLNDDTKLICNNINIANNKVVIQESVTQETFEVPIKLISSIKILEN